MLGGQLLSLAINHMTTPASSFEELLSLAVENGCAGVEVRNDLEQPLFSGMSATKAGLMAKASGIRILGIAQLTEFNCWSAEKAEQARQLIQLASESNAEAVCLIPRNDGNDCEPAIRVKNLREALTGLAPLLRSAGIKGLIEPLGFTTASLTSKAEVVEVIVQLDVADCFQLVHDTFHHYLAGGGPVFPACTGIVHVSGISDRTVSAKNMADTHRGLVDCDDVLDNTGQIKAMINGGFNGSVSMEAFAPQVHESPDLAAQLRDSFNFINSGLATVVA